MLSRKPEPEDLKKLKVAIRQATLSPDAFQGCGGPNEQASSIYFHKTSRRPDSRTIGIKYSSLRSTNGPPATRQDGMANRTTSATLSRAGLTVLGHVSWSGLITSDSLRLSTRQIGTREDLVAG